MAVPLDPLDRPRRALASPCEKRIHDLLERESSSRREPAEVLRRLIPPYRHTTALGYVTTPARCTSGGTLRPRLAGEANPLRVVLRSTFASSAGWNGLTNPCRMSRRGRRAEMTQSPMRQDRLFRDRRDAGRVVATLLNHYRDRPGVLVLGLPRGGVPVAYEVAMASGAPLDVFLVRKLGVPGHDEVAMGAIASGGVLVTNDDVVRGLGISPEVIERVAEREGRELLRREQAYREGRPPLDVAGKTVILVDDGLATGASMRAAIQALRQQHRSAIVVAVPAAPESTCRELAAVVDGVVCATTPSPFFAVGASYWDFTQTTDEEVRDLLRAASTSTTRATVEPITDVAVIRREAQTEWASHYFQARAADQFDALVHIDEARPVEPLERTSRWETGEVPETYPFAV